LSAPRGADLPKRHPARWPLHDPRMRRPSAIQQIYRRQCPPGWTPQLEALARAELCEAFLQLTVIYFEAKVVAATLLGLCPSAVSGKSSMLRRYQDGGLKALMPVRRPRWRSRVSQAAWALMDGCDLLYHGEVIASAVAPATGTFAMIAPGSDHERCRLWKPAPKTPQRKAGPSRNSRPITDSVNLPD
jgi:hypothetical protein